MQQALKTIIVTGSNKGIGYGIVEHLASINPPHWHVIMACRSIERAKATHKGILEKHPYAKVEVEELDVSNEQSIHKFIELLPQKYPQGIDVLVNNAGIAWKGDAFDSQVVKGTFATNFYGTITLSEAIIPYINQNGKIITVGSMVGKYKLLKTSDLLEKFRKDNISKEELLNLMHLFEDSVKDGTFAEKGFAKSAYGLSKLGINVYTTRILARREDIKQKGIQVYGMCPGYVATDMTSHKGHLTLEQGIQTPLFLINLPFQVDNKYQGKFFEKEAVSTLEVDVPASA